MQIARKAPSQLSSVCMQVLCIIRSFPFIYHPISLHLYFFSASIFDAFEYSFVQIDSFHFFFMLIVCLRQIQSLKQTRKKLQFHFMWQQKPWRQLSHEIEFRMQYWRWESWTVHKNDLWNIGFVTFFFSQRILEKRTVNKTYSMFHINRWVNCSYWQASNTHISTFHIIFYFATHSVNSDQRQGLK